MIMDQNINIWDKIRMLLSLLLFLWTDKATLASPPGCGSVINNTLTSPGYPNGYPDSLHCVYKVPILQGMATKITFQDFNLLRRITPVECWDYLKITVNNEGVGEKYYCGGELAGKEFVVGGDTAVITFQTGMFYFEGRGFLIEFTAIPATSPKITLPDPAPIIRAYPGYKLWCSATGTLPLHIVLTKNSTVLANSTNTATITLSEEGNYSCTASSHYGTDKKHFSVVFIDCRHQCAQSLSWKSLNTLLCRNATSLARIIECTPTLTEDMDLYSNDITFLTDESFDNFTNLVEL